MRKTDTRDYYDSPKQRVKEGVVAIYDLVSPADWALVPALCSAFYQEFEASLLLHPMSGQTSLEVWFLVQDNLPHGVSLGDAEDFVGNYFEVLHRA